MESERTPVHKNNHKRLACRGEGVDEPHLGFRKFDGCAIAAFESLYVQWHLFAFDLRAQTEEGNDGIGFGGCGDRLISQRRDRRIPGKCEACSEVRRVVDVLDADWMRIGISEGYGERLCRCAPAVSCHVSEVKDQFAVEPDPNRFTVLAGTAMRQ